MVFVFTLTEAKTQTRLDRSLDPRTGVWEHDVPVPNSVQEKLDARERNYDFHYLMRSIHEPSFVTSKITWNWWNLGTVKKNYVLDADVNIPIALGGKRMGLSTFHVIPRFIVRIFHDDMSIPYGPKGDDSFPVRTPSTIPGLAWYFTFKSLWESGQNDHANYFFGIYAFHHSNGQDGDEIYPDNTVNIYNGSFGEQVVFDFTFFGFTRITDFNDDPWQN